MCTQAHTMYVVQYWTVSEVQKKHRGRKVYWMSYDPSCFTVMTWPPLSKWVLPSQCTVTSASPKDPNQLQAQSTDTWSSGPTTSTLDFRCLSLKKLITLSVLLMKPTCLFSFTSSFQLLRSTAAVSLWALGFCVPGFEGSLRWTSATTGEWSEIEVSVPVRRNLKRDITELYQSLL